MIESAQWSRRYDGWRLSSFFNRADVVSTIRTSCLRVKGKRLDRYLRCATLEDLEDNLPLSLLWKGHGDKAGTTYNCQEFGMIPRESGVSRERPSGGGNW